MRTVGCVVTLLALLALHGTARSQPQPQSADAAQQADEHFWKGKALLKAGNVRGAYEEYKAAFNLRKSFDAAANLGNLELSLGMPRDAAEHLAFSLRNYAPTGATAATLDRTRQLLAQARAQVTTLTIQVNVDGAEVAIDGQVVGRSPIVEEVYVDPGEHTIEARLVSYPTARVTINPEKGGSQQVALKLDAPAPPPTASATTTAPPPSPRPSKPVLIAGGAAAGVGVVLGAVFAGVSSSKASSVATQRTALMKTGTPVMCGVGAQATSACADLADTVNAKRTFANASVWSFVGGGAVGVATLIYGLATPKRAAPAKPDVRVVPAAGPQGAGLELRGTW
jgi:hypothetical protein